MNGHGIRPLQIHFSSYLQCGKQTVVERPSLKKITGKISKYFIARHSTLHSTKTLDPVGIFNKQQLRKHNKNKRKN